MIVQQGSLSANSGRSKTSRGEALFVRITNGSDCGFSLLLIDTTIDYWNTPPLNGSACILARESQSNLIRYVFIIPPKTNNK